MSSKETIFINRYIVRKRRRYSVPARYSSYTKYFAVAGGKVYSGGHRTYKKFIEAIQKKFGTSYNYVIETDRPSVNYI